MFCPQNVTALRMLRQHLTEKADEEAFEKLFRDMSPVPCQYWSAPGSPPRIVFRAAFDDGFFSDRRRSRREIVKGRFAGGSVGYIEPGEWELFAGLYRKPIDRLNTAQRRLLDLLRQEGPMTIGGMKELTGMLVKEIVPQLHRLQEAFLVYEDQIDSEGDRGWYLFEDEFDEVDVSRYTRAEALREALPRFAKLQVVFNADMAKSFYRLPGKEIEAAVDSLLADGSLAAAAGGYIAPADRLLLEANEFPLPPSAYVLHRNDFLVKSNEHWLKETYKRDGLDTLFYILADGVFRGAVYGHFKNGPFQLEDVGLNWEQADARKEEVIEAVYAVNDRNASPLARFNGKLI